MIIATALSSFLLAAVPLAHAGSDQLQFNGFSGLIINPLETKYFGGKQLFVFDQEICSCQENDPEDRATNIHYIWDYKTDAELKLYYDGSATIYKEHNLETGTYQVGSYTKESRQCMMQTDDGCVEIDDTEGTYNSSPGTGTSLSMNFDGTELAQALSVFLNNPVALANDLFFPKS